MIRLVTQYNNVSVSGKIFDIGLGWDRAKGPWLFASIDDRNILKTKASLGNGRTHRPDQWLSINYHLTPFRLELTYE